MSNEPFNDSGDPFDDPPWKEAGRHADECTYPRAGYIGFPEEWLEQVLPLVNNSAQQLAVALLMYRHLRYDKAVPISNAEFEVLGISRRAKYRTLAALERAGLIAVESTNGRTTAVRLVAALQRTT
jgi:hypothetical protein